MEKLALALQKPRAIELRFTWEDFIVFWVVGGLSVAFFVLMRLVDGMLPKDLAYHASWWAYYLAFAVNYPHFAHSYQLFYSGFSGYMRDSSLGLVARVRFFICGIAVPLAMIAVFSWIYATQDAALMGYAVSTMFFLVGWHYVKQGYGVLITLSARRKIYYGAATKKALVVNAYAVWAYAWIRANQMIVEHKYYDIPWKTFDMPEWLMGAAFYAMVLCGAASLLLLLREWVFKGRDVSFSGVTGYVAASYLWVLVPYTSPLYFLFVPMFHSMQYLLFVYWYKFGEVGSPASPADGRAGGGILSGAQARLAVFLAIGVALGAVFMDVFPKQIDAWHAGGGGLFSQSFFLVAFLLFINIHHYFIDHAFWRRDNKKVQKFLFKRAEAL